MSVALLDVNVLIALLDRRHVHHEPAHGWFATAQADGWATCPLTRKREHCECLGQQMDRLAPGGSA